MIIIDLFLMSYILNKFFCSKFLYLMNCSKHLQFNYKELKIPNSMGLSISITQIVLLIFIFVYYNDYNMIIIILCGSLVSFMGILDDFLGNDSKGLKEHLLEFLNGKITTGFLKIILGFISSIFTSYLFYNNFCMFFLDVFIICLSINTLNLLDVTPGRALKFFYIISLFILILTSYNNYDVLIIMIIGSSLAYFPLDIKGKSMLGDIGANLLGFYLGVSLIINNINKFVIVFILLILNLLSEKISLSYIIKNNKILNYIDYLGRGDGG
ncbi:hypothetical protein GOQ29_11405 [Clostridium sp. D2Q-14]|uniref:hypothetical protein n=1 Tax=Anaeromonas gelatinilytica TaxID=2683194 RepID=UPI00193B71E5|nr:hypothetical protein [Anaeromonas gelatinilytica]MBS4536223.1 hypothetical protein [Anaeromonas gelatinilytica]